MSSVFWWDVFALICIAMWSRGGLGHCGVQRMRTGMLTILSPFFLWASKNLIKSAESGLICAGLMGFPYSMWLKILSESICQSQLIVWPLTNIGQTVGKYVSEHWAVLNYTPDPGLSDLLRDDVAAVSRGVGFVVGNAHGAHQGVSSCK